jgi:hypothetical protein
MEKSADIQWRFPRARMGDGSSVKKATFRSGKTAAGKFFTMWENLKKFKKNLDIHYRNIYICAKFKAGGIHRVYSHAPKKGTRKRGAS